MNSDSDELHTALVGIHNVTQLTTKDVERYCSQYDKNIRCFRRKNRHQREYIHALFSSMVVATNFLNDRPHFIRNIRVNASLVNEAVTGPKFVCVQMDRNAWISEDDLFRYTLKTFGHVNNCVLYENRGYAFVEFQNLADAHRALASSNQQINGFPIQYRPRQNLSKVLPLIPLTRTVHIGNFHLYDQEKLPSYFPDLQNYTTHRNCFGQIYMLAIFDSNASIQLLLKRAFCLNGRVLNIFVENDDQLTECDNYLLVRHVPFRLNDYNLLEYFSQFGYVLNCFRHGQTDAYRIQYRDRVDLEGILQTNRIHVIKSVQLQIERDRT